MKIEIWSDVACPWCYVGKRRFEQALAQFPHREQVTVSWRSFELDPTAPAEVKESASEHLSEKYGVSVADAQKMNSQLTGTAAQEGLQYELERQRLGSTFDAHRLIHLAAEHGLQDAMKERLMRARLCEAQLVSDPEVLVQCAADVGVPEVKVREMLASDRFADDVRDDERTATALGISAVPTFVIDRKVGLAGAHPSAALLEFLNETWDSAGAERN